MPAGTHNNMHTPRVRNGEPQPALALTPEPASSRRDLTSWWRQFSKRPAKKDDEKGMASPPVSRVQLLLARSACSPLQAARERSALSPCARSPHYRVFLTGNH